VSGIGAARETYVDHVGGRRAMTKDEADLKVCMNAGDEAGTSLFDECGYGSPVGGQASQFARSSIHH